MNELINTVDGLMVQKTPQTEIAVIFSKLFNNSVLVLVKEFWSKKHENMNVIIFKNCLFNL